jgi:hypothetical protein
MTDSIGIDPSIHTSYGILSDTTNREFHFSTFLERRLTAEGLQ